MDFTRILLSWYDQYQRDLPWRRTRDPYKIWISEIIMQQTRIEQGTGYYHRILDRFSTVNELAAADETEVLRLWQGLGYYSRARNLLHAAREIVTLHGGKFPSTYQEIRKLRGIGDYTAAAIASIAFDLPFPVVDGNVLRFFTRYFGIFEPVDKALGKKQVLALAVEKLDTAGPGQFNQAIMEFGALQCKSGVPDCTTCPFRESCYAFIHGKISDLPVKSAAVKQRKRYFNYLVMVYHDPAEGEIVYLRKREENDIWKNLYDFPLVESSGPVSLKKLVQSAEWKSIVNTPTKGTPNRSEVYQHILTHQLIYARFYVVRMKKKPVTGFVPVYFKDIGGYPVPRLIEKFFTTWLEDKFQ